MRIPSSIIKAALVIIVTALVALVVFLFTRPDPPENGEAGTDVASKSAKSMAHSPRPSAGTPGVTRKSQGRDEVLQQEPGITVVEKSKRKKLMIAISVRARNELKGLRERYQTEFDSPEARKEFSDTLRNVTDPQERERLVRERTTAMRIARDKADAEKGFPGRAREKRLIALMQVQNLWRMNSFVARNETLKTEAGQFDDRLAEWVANEEEMSDEDFHESFNTLRHTLNDLRVRNQAAAPGSP